MKLNKPEFWKTKNNTISILLYPVSLIILFFIFLKKKFTKIIKFDVYIICVGNIYIGGTGKTPASIYLANELLRSGKNPVILRKFYKNHADEHNLIKAKFQSLILSQDRIDGIKSAKKKEYDTVILDDGFQDYRIKKNLSILCFNQNQLIGNGRVIPSGPLRENLNSLNNADIVLINGKKDNVFEKKILNINRNLKVFYSHYKPLNLDQFKNKQLLAVAGIGNPENFFNLLESNNLNVKKKLAFPDHHLFSETEVQKIINEAENNDYQIIMTEKDYFKIKDLNFTNIKYLKISLEVNEKEKFIKTIDKIYEKKY